MSAGNRAQGPDSAGRRLLAARMQACAPALLRELGTALPVVSRALAGARRIVTTGIGSSEAHARFLASLLAFELGLAARFRHAGDFLAEPPGDAESSALVVFSQGLSPNARFALAAPERWAALVLCTSARAEDCDAERRAWLERVLAAGGQLIPLGGADARDEFGTLVRVVGPLLGLATALRLARALARARGAAEPPGWAPAAPELEAALARAPQAFAEALARAPADAASRPFAFLASGEYAERVANLPLKCQEGLLRARPPLIDPISFAHGPLQQGWEAELCWIALERPDAPGEAELLERIARLLDPRRHALLRLRASLPSPCAAFEHELMLNRLLLERCEAEAIDPARWPARDLDGPLYGHAPQSVPGSGARPPASGRASLAPMSWPELEARIAAGARTAIVPLGAIEQHGPHLPFATDAWIADALAERVCARLPGAIRIPALALGCSEEHAAFPGTLSLAPDTLRAVLGDLLRSLARAGFERACVFSAHGGNDAWLRAFEPELAAGCAPLALAICADAGAKSAFFAGLAERAGVPPEAAGHHAGEFETSILLALAPDAVKRGELRPGLRAGRGDAQALFYPSLRRNAPEGTVGDPTLADPRRAATYLDAWAEWLVAGFAGSSSRAG